MDDEEGQHSDKKQVHEQAHKVERRVELTHTRIGMRLILHEVDIRAGVALAARGHQVGLVHGGMGIGLVAHIMRFVTVPAARRFHVAAQQAAGGCSMAWAVWQSEHTGALILPAATALP